MNIKKKSAKQVNHIMTTFLTEEDRVFHRNMTTLVSYKFPAARKSLCKQLGDFIAVRNRMLAKDKRLAESAIGQESKSEYQDINPEFEWIKSFWSNGKWKKSPIQPEEEMLDRHEYWGTLYLEESGTWDPHDPIAAQIGTMPVTDKNPFRYPPVPKPTKGETQARCPICSMTLLDFKGFEKEKKNHWQRHIDGHIEPYVCLFPVCAEAMVSFVHLHDWKAHMRNNHSTDWLRRIHTSIWYCDLNHRLPETFDTELQWRTHMQDLTSHPSLNSIALTKTQLDSLAPKQQKHVLRKRFVCPFCEEVPKDIGPLVVNGRGTSMDAYESLLDHVADHMKSMFLMSLPCLEDNVQESPGTPESSIVLENSVQRLIHEKSIPQPPSGTGQMDAISFSLNSCSEFNKDRIFCIRSDTKSRWDWEYDNYTSPEIPPEQIKQEWVEVWKDWKNKNDPFFQHSPENDPVLVHIITTRQYVSGTRVRSVSSYDAQSRKQLLRLSEIGSCLDVKRLLDRGAHIETTDQVGQTPLIRAAKKKREEIVRLLLDNKACTETPDSICSQTPLIWAASKGHYCIVQQLLDRGANVNTVNNSGQTSISLAASGGHKATVELLIYYSARLEIPDREFGRTPLIWAVIGGHCAIVKQLLDSGAKVDTVDKYHKTALSWAYEKSESKGWDIVTVLLRNGASVKEISTTPHSRVRLTAYPTSWPVERLHKNQW